MKFKLRMATRNLLKVPTYYSGELLARFNASTGYYFDELRRRGEGPEEGLLAASADDRVRIATVYYDSNLIEANDVVSWFLERGLVLKSR